MTEAGYSCAESCSLAQSCLLAHSAWNLNPADALCGLGLVPFALWSQDFTNSVIGVWLEPALPCPAHPAA